MKHFCTFHDKNIIFNDHFEANDPPDSTCIFTVTLYSLSANAWAHLVRCKEYTQRCRTHIAAFVALLFVLLSLPLSHFYQSRT